MEPGEARPGASEAKGGGNARVAGGTKMMAAESSVPEGTVIEKLTSIHNGRLGKLLNQLQILGVDTTHLNRIKVHLTSALGDDSGNKFRVLQQAIEQLVQDKSLGRVLGPTIEQHDDGFKPEDIERLAAQAKTVTTYVPAAQMHALQHGDWKAVQVDGPRQRTPLSAQGDLAPIMVDGSMIGIQQVLQEAREKQAGRPMLGAAVMKDSFDYRGDTQIDIEDKTGPPAVFVPVVATGPIDKKEEGKDVLRRESVITDEPALVSKSNEPRRTENEITKPRIRKKKPIRQTFKQLNAALYHPHEDNKGIEMRHRIGLDSGGPGRFNDVQHENGGTAPMPGSQLWTCMLFTSTDMSKSGSCGGHMLDPPLFLGIPVAIPTVCLSDHHKSGLQYATLYTDVDGYVYRGSAGKDKAIEWITRMRTRFLKNVMAFKSYTPMEDEPKWVRRKPHADIPGHDAVAIRDDAELRAAFSEANSMFVNLWQVFVRGPGAYSQICRVVHDFTGMAEDTGHYMLSCTHELGSKASFTGGYFVDSNDIKGTKAQGRSTIINKVFNAGWAEHVVTAARLINYAHAVFPYRRQPNGSFKQKLPKFSPDFMVVDFLVSRDGTWLFSNAVVLRSHRNGKAVTTVSGGSASEKFYGPNTTCSLLEDNFIAVKKSLAMDMTRRFGLESRPDASATWTGEAPSSLQRQSSNSRLLQPESSVLSTVPLKQDSKLSTLSRTMSQGSLHKQTIMSEKAASFDPLKDIYDDLSDSEHSNDDQLSGPAGRSSLLVASREPTKVAGITRRILRPRTAESNLTCRLTLEKVNHLASNPRMQASSSRVLREILVARSRAESAGMTRQDDAPSKVWSLLKRRICAVALSDPRSKNPANDPALLMRLGVNSEALPVDASDPETSCAGDIIPSKSKKIANKSALSMHDHSHERRRPSTLPPRVPPGDMTNAVKSAAKALGHPI